LHNLHVRTGVPYLDPGATAYDTVDGNVTSLLEAYGVGAVVTTAPTLANQPFVVTYGVTDAAGNSAVTMRRRVNVVCPTVRCLLCVSMLA
jgi:hypothetical protein